jgi:solute carrier family 13 (sodium-dependent dicarboxylate transporter), member 2/3/5
LLCHQGGEGELMAARWGLWGGLAAFVIMLVLPAPAGMPAEAWRTTALVVLMATWWMTQALPLTATAFLPFLLLPMLGVMSAGDAAGKLLLADPVPRAGRRDHRFGDRADRPPPAPCARHRQPRRHQPGRDASGLHDRDRDPVDDRLEHRDHIDHDPDRRRRPSRRSYPGRGDGGFAGALVIGIAFSASIGGLGTLVGSPTNAIAAGIFNRLTGTEINFLTWADVRPSAGRRDYSARLADHQAGPEALAPRFRPCSPRAPESANPAPGRSPSGGWCRWSRRWSRPGCSRRSLAPLLPAGALTDGTIAIAGAMLLFVIPDGTGRPLLTWKEADRAPWGVIMMFGGGLALASGIGDSGLATWVGTALEPMGGVHPVIIALVLVAIVILVTEFASNVASASSAMPVVAGLVLATGADPYLLAMPAAMAASWAFMLPSGTGPNAIAWATGHVALPRLLKAGLMMNLMAPPLIVGIVWMIRTLLG